MSLLTSAATMIRFLQPARRAQGCISWACSRWSKAPKGAWPSLQGGRYYKHGAPNGAEPISVAEDTYYPEAYQARYGALRPIIPSNAEVEARTCAYRDPFTFKPSPARLRVARDKVIKYRSPIWQPAEQSDRRTTGLMQSSTTPLRRHGRQGRGQTKQPF